MSVPSFVVSAGQKRRRVKARDPRLSPQIGDLLAIGRDRRRVQGVDERVIVFGPPDGVAIRRCSLSAWQEWASTALVEEVGHA